MSLHLHIRRATSLLYVHAQAAHSGAAVFSRITVRLLPKLLLGRDSLSRRSCEARQEAAVHSSSMEVWGSAGVARVREIVPDSMRSQSLVEEIVRTRVEEGHAVQAGPSRQTILFCSGVSWLVCTCRCHLRCVIVGNEATRAWLGYDGSSIGRVRIAVAEAFEFFLCRLKLGCFACRAASRGLLNGCSHYRIYFLKFIV